MLSYTHTEGVVHNNVYRDVVLFMYIFNVSLACMVPSPHLALVGLSLPFLHKFFGNVVNMCSFNCTNMKRVQVRLCAPPC